MFRARIERECGQCGPFPTFRGLRLGVGGVRIAGWKDEWRIRKRLMHALVTRVAVWLVVELRRESRLGRRQRDRSHLVKKGKKTRKGIKVKEN